MDFILLTIGKKMTKKLENKESEDEQVPMCISTGGMHLIFDDFILTINYKTLLEVIQEIAIQRRLENITES